MRDGPTNHDGSRLTLPVESNSERYLAIDTNSEGQYQGFWKGKPAIRVAIYKSEEICCRSLHTNHHAKSCQKNSVQKRVQLLSQFVPICPSAQQKKLA